MAKKGFSVGYVFVMYDVGENRVVKVNKICKKYLEAHQNSVFRGVITPSNLIKLETELKKVINEDYDKVTIIKMRNDHMFEELHMGVDQSESIFI